MSMPRFLGQGSHQIMAGYRMSHGDYCTQYITVVRLQGSSNTYAHLQPELHPYWLDLSQYPQHPPGHLSAGETRDSFAPICDAARQTPFFQSDADTGPHAHKTRGFPALLLQAT